VTQQGEEKKVVTRKTLKKGNNHLKNIFIYSERKRQKSDERGAFIFFTARDEKTSVDVLVLFSSHSQFLFFFFLFSRLLYNTTAPAEGEAEAAE
jgi:hypothetical protein